MLAEFVQKKETWLTNYTGDAQIAKGMIFYLVVRCYAAPDYASIPQGQRLRFIFNLLNMTEPRYHYDLTDEMLVTRVKEAERVIGAFSGIQKIAQSYGATKVAEIPQEKRTEFHAKVDALIADAKAWGPAAEAKVEEVTP